MKLMEDKEIGKAAALRLLFAAPSSRKGYPADSPPPAPAPAQERSCPGWLRYPEPLTAQTYVVSGLQQHAGPTASPPR
jgi:hypothetical protein